MSLKRITPIKAFGDTVGRLWGKGRRLRAVAFAFWAPVARLCRGSLGAAGWVVGISAGVLASVAAVVAIGATLLATVALTIWHGVIRFFEDTVAWLGMVPNQPVSL